MVLWVLWEKLWEKLFLQGSTWHLMTNYPYIEPWEFLQPYLWATSSSWWLWKWGNGADLAPGVACWVTLTGSWMPLNQGCCQTAIWTSGSDFASLFIGQRQHLMCLPLHFMPTQTIDERWHCKTIAWYLFKKLRLAGYGRAFAGCLKDLKFKGEAAQWNLAQANKPFFIVTEIAIQNSCLLWIQQFPHLDNLTHSNLNYLMLQATFRSDLQQPIHDLPLSYFWETKNFMCNSSTYWASWLL